MEKMYGTSENRNSDYLSNNTNKILIFIYLFLLIYLLILINYKIIKLTIII